MFIHRKFCCTSRRQTYELLTFQMSAFHKSKLCSTEDNFILTYCVHCHRVQGIFCLPFPVHFSLFIRSCILVGVLAFSFSLLLLLFLYSRRTLCIFFLSFFLSFNKTFERRFQVGRHIGHIVFNPHQLSRIRLFQIFKSLLHLMSC